MIRSIVLVASLLASTTHADPWYQGKHGKNRVVHASITAAGALAYTLSETVFKARLSSSTCRWCEPDSFDASVRHALVWGNTRAATDASNVFGFFFAPTFGIGLTFTTAAAGDTSWAAVIDDTLPVMETVVLSQLVVQSAKFSFARQRPGVHFGAPGTPQLEDNVSFFSGHAALTFGLATSAGLIAHRRHYRSEPWFWTFGMSFAVTASYLRIAADKHYLTDVLTGAAVGVGAGLTVPLLMDRPDVHVVPTGSGAALVGQF